MRKYRKVLSRRTLLRGAGTVAIALPFLDEMRAASVFAADPPPPPRVLTMFFGLGIPSPFQGDAYVRPFAEHMAPLAEIANKVALVRGVYFDKGSRTTGNHARGSQTVFIGDMRSGASIDQVVLDHFYPGTSPTAVRSLVAGTYTRQDGNERHVHSWAGANRPTAQPIESPRELFDRAFGSFMPPMSDDRAGEDAARAARYERSVLDAALQQYRYVTSDAFGLSETSKAKIHQHVERLRELELRIYDPEAPMMPPPADGAACPPSAPPGFTDPEMVEIQRTVNNEGVRMEINRWMELWHAMVEVYVMAVRCDVTRFGNLQFQSGGERIRLYGSYTAYGQTRTFDDDDTTHEYWHSWSPGNEEERKMRDHMWLFMAELTHYLKALDDGDYRDPNGGTLLDNALVMASTELGDGNRHDIEDVFHLVAGANGRIRTGDVLDVDAQATEIYNAGLRAVGVDTVSMHGEPSFDGSVESSLLV